MGSSINDRSDSPIELSPSGIDILIVGTGFAGLTAALECTRKGHHVRLLERNASHNMAGKATHNESGPSYSLIMQATCTSWVSALLTS